MIKYFIGIFLGAVIQHFVAQWLRERAQLVYYVQSISDHNIQGVQVPVRQPSPQEPNPPRIPLRVFTHSISIRNNGSRPARNVEVTHTYLPAHVTITPADVRHTVDTVNRIIRFDSIVPGQLITIGYLNFIPYSFDDIFRTVVKSEEGFARALAMTQYPLMPKWFNWTVWVLLVLGILFVIFIAYKLSPYIAQGYSWFVDVIKN